MEDPFRPLMEGLGFPESPFLRQILEYLMTPEQARVAAALPGSVRDVANNLGMPEERVREILEDLWRKGVVFPKDFDKREQFRFARELVQLHDATLATQNLDLERDKKYFR
ncbi:MAG: hypothetical protein QW084_05125, partial [Candidatus Hadarchaeales archaeon]